MNLTVKPIDSKTWGLFINDSLLGTSKNRFDADHGKVIIENALDRVAQGLDAPSVPDSTGNSSVSEQFQAELEPLP